jgi:hypothetical protein
MPSHEPVKPGHTLGRGVGRTPGPTPVKLTDVPVLGSHSLIPIDRVPDRDQPFWSQCRSGKVSAH